MESSLLLPSIKKIFFETRDKKIPLKKIVANFLKLPFVLLFKTHSTLFATKLLHKDLYLFLIDGSNKELSIKQNFLCLKKNSALFSQGLCNFVFY